MKSCLSIKVSVLALAVAIGPGCAHKKQKNELEPEAPPVIYPTIVEVQNVSEGSLWAGDDNWSLFTDLRAGSPGDLVLVRVIENSEAERRTETEIGRDANVKAGITNFFGQEAQFGTGRRSNGNRQDVDVSNLIKADSQSKFESEATVKQSGKVLANVMAQVIERRPDGNLRIFGSQVVTIGSEDQVVTVTGMIRPSDIGPDNSISSQLIADARIVYSGRGPGETSSRPGWLMKAYYAVWPF